jgi:hypothetical protein
VEAAGEEACLMYNGRIGLLLRLGFVFGFMPVTWSEIAVLAGGVQPSVALLFLAMLSRTETKEEKGSVFDISFNNLISCVASSSS